MKRIIFKSLGILLISVFIATTLLTFNSLGHTTSQSGELFFTILHTNDEHSALVPSPLIDYREGEKNPSLGGFARLAQAVTKIRQDKENEGEPVVLISAGDYLGGSPYAWLSLQGHAAELSLMQEIGYDVITIGNHEYDYGPDRLGEYLRAAGYPKATSKTVILASNTIPPSGHGMEEMGIKKTYIKELENGLRLGFFGLIGKDAITVAPGTSPVTFSDQIETAKEKVGQLKEEGADIIIAVPHSGLKEVRELAKEVKGIDIIVGGHCHTAIKEPIIEGRTIIVQSGELLQYLGVLEIAYNQETGDLRIRNSETETPSLLPLDYRIPSEPKIISQIDYYTSELNDFIANMTDGRFLDVKQVIVKSDFKVNNRPKLSESPFGNFVTDGMRIKAEEVTGERVDLAFQANGAIRGGIIPGSMPYSMGEVALFDLVDLIGLGSGPDGLPGYPLVSAYFTGDEIRRILEISVLLSELMGDTYYLQVSGLQMTYDPNRAILMTASHTLNSWPSLYIIASSSSIGFPSLSFITRLRLGSISPTIGRNDAI